MKRLKQIFQIKFPITPYGIGLLILLFASCEKESNLKVPAYKAKLVLHSFICPSDTFVRVHVSTTQNIYGKQQNIPRLLPVKVTLFDGDKSISLGDMDNTGTCSVRYSIQPGKEYKITAQCEGYPEASAVCTVPVENNFSVTVDTIVRIVENIYDSAPLNFTQFIVKFADVPNQLNYYNVFARATFYNKEDTFIVPCNIYGEKEEDFEYSNLYSDHFSAGKDVTTIFTCSEYYMTFYDSIFFEVILLETDEDYYKYHSSTLNYEGYDDPFVEFSPLYFNVEGGYGIFASYIKHKAYFRIK